MPSSQGRVTKRLMSKLMAGLRVHLCPKEVRVRDFVSSRPRENSCFRGLRSATTRLNTPTTKQWTVLLLASSPLSRFRS